MDHDGNRPRSKSIEDEDIDLEIMADNWNLSPDPDPRVDREMAGAIGRMPSNLSGRVPNPSPPVRLSPLSKRKELMMRLRGTGHVTPPPPQETGWQPWAQGTPPRATGGGTKRNWALQASPPHHAPPRGIATSSHSHSKVSDWLLDQDVPPSRQTQQAGWQSPPRPTAPGRGQGVFTSRWRTGSGSEPHNPNEPIRRDPGLFYTAPGEPGDPNTHTPGLGLRGSRGNRRHYRGRRFNPY